jgi:hypothetical protein
MGGRRAGAAHDRGDHPLCSFAACVPPKEWSAERVRCVATTIVEITTSRYRREFRTNRARATRARRAR